MGAGYSTESGERLHASPPHPPEMIQDFQGLSIIISSDMRYSLRLSSDIVRCQKTQKISDSRETEMWQRSKVKLGKMKKRKLLKR